MIQQQLSLEKEFRIAQYEAVTLPSLQDKAIRFEIVKFVKLANANYLSLSQVMTEQMTEDVVRNMEDAVRNFDQCISIASNKRVTRKTLMAVATSAFAWWLGSIELIEKLGKEGGN